MAFLPEEKVTALHTLTGCSPDSLDCRHDSNTIGVNIHLCARPCLAMQSIQRFTFHFKPLERYLCKLSERDPSLIDCSPDPLACSLNVLYCDLNPCLSAGSGLAADISLGAVNGAAAVQYVRNMVQAAPPLKTLVLFVKALLKVYIHAGLDCCDGMQPASRCARH